MGYSVFALRVLAMADYILAFRILKQCSIKFLLLASDLTKLRSVSIVPLGRAIFLMIPGTSCLATILLSLRDKAIRPIDAPHRCIQIPAGKRNDGGRLGSLPGGRRLFRPVIFLSSLSTIEPDQAA